MRRAARTDDNHAEIVNALRRAGVTVQSLASIGKGVPDLLCGHRGRNYLLEVKDGSKPLSKRMLTADERKWHAVWNGQVETVETVEEALSVVGL